MVTIDHDCRRRAFPCHCHSPLSVHQDVILPSSPYVYQWTTPTPGGSTTPSPAVAIIIIIIVISSINYLACRCIFTIVTAANKSCSTSQYYYEENTIDDCDGDTGNKQRFFFSVVFASSGC
jgi:hypothetical protein